MSLLLPTLKAIYGPDINSNSVSKKKDIRTYFKA